MIQLFSPAKINLFFKLLEEREDGYHNIESFFQAVNLGDTLSIKFAQKDRFTSNLKDLGFNDANFIIKALFVFRKKTGLNQTVDIFLDKKIPLEAGLGGGSSNAATTLWGLNELHGRPATLHQLLQWASEITSDSPFFFSLGTAFCEKKGEVVHSMPPLTSTAAWVVKPPYGNSTKEVYKAAKKSSLTTLSKEALIQKIYSSSPHYHNDLEPPAFKLSSALSILKNKLELQGFSSVFMTGSGTSLVCIGKNKPVLKNPVQIFPIQYINRSPDQWYNP